MAAKVRVTSRTDTRGSVNADYRGAYEIKALANAAKAGIPGPMLHPGGWDSDENDLTGFYAEQIYKLGEIGFTPPDCIAQITAVIDVMQKVCRTFNVDPQLAIPYGMARFLRQLHEGNERRRAIERGETWSVSPGADEFYGVW